MRTRFARIALEHITEIRPVRGADKLLLRLKSSGVMVAVATNRGNTSGPLLEALSFSRFVDVLVTSEDVSRLKPDPEALQLALKRAGVRAADALYVGDTDVDARAGKAAGIKTVLLSNKCGGCESVRSLDEIRELVC